MNTTPAQLVDAATANGKATVIVKAGGLSSADAQGSSNGEKVINEALQRVVGPALARAGELLRVIRTCEGKEQELRTKLTNLDQQKVAAPHAKFGAELDAHLQELQSEIYATDALIDVTRSERVQAERELPGLRDTVLAAAPGYVKKAVRERIRTAEAERDKAAEVLAVAVAQHLTAVLKLDAELDVLDGLKPTRTVKRALEAGLPEVFGEGGLVSIPALEAEQERQREREERREKYATEESFDLAKMPGLTAQGLSDRDPDRDPDREQLPFTRDDLERELNRED